MKDLLSRLRYTNDADNSYRYYIFTRLLVNVLRGLWYKIFYLHCRGAISIAKRVRIIGPRSGFIIGSNCKIEENVLIQTVSLKKIILGDNVTICYGALIRPSGYYSGNLGEGLSMGNFSSIGANSYIGCSGFIKIGNNVMMGPNINLMAENHNFLSTEIPMIQQGVSNKGITIEDDVWIGAKATILDGVVIGKGSIIAAGAVITSSVEPYSIMAGVPGRKIKSRMAGQ